MSGQDAKPLKRLGRYELLELLGRGGMAEVYKARLPGALGFDKMVAVKRILPEARTNKEYVDMFVREARLCSRMMHPNLIQVFEFAETDGELFLAMELVEGSDLRKMITAHKQLGKSVPLEFATLLAQGVLRGLDGAHRLTDERGAPLKVVHRDLSPANVLLSYEGAIKVADFGVAHQGEREDADSNSVKGKLQYMAPEQLLSGEVDERVDVFAAGCVLYEMLSGSPVYPFGQTPEVIQKVARGLYTPVEQLVPGIHRELAAIVSRALAPNRDQRFSDCAVFANEIARLVQSGAVPCASGEDLGLYLQVLLPKQPFRAELAHTPSAEDMAVPILTGTIEDAPSSDEPGPLTGSLLPDDVPLTAPIPVSRTHVHEATALKPPLTPSPGARPPSPGAVRVETPFAAPTPPGGIGRPAARPPSGGTPPARRPTPVPADLDSMLRAYLDEADPEKAEAPKVEVKPEKKWLKWLK